MDEQLFEDIDAAHLRVQDVMRMVSSCVPARRSAKSDNDRCLRRLDRVLQFVDAYTFDHFSPEFELRQLRYDVRTLRGGFSVDGFTELIVDDALAVAEGYVSLLARGLFELQRERTYRERMHWAKPWATAAAWMIPRRHRPEYAELFLYHMFSVAGSNSFWRGVVYKVRLFNWARTVRAQLRANPV